MVLYLGRSNSKFFHQQLNRLIRYIYESAIDSQLWTTW
jgi:hypothetical protein